VVTVVDKPPFDPLRGAFWLVAGVLAVQCAVVLASAGACLYWTPAIVEGKVSCGPVMDRLGELLATALAAAIAFSALRDRK
jgi:hypothetical protein